MSIELMTGVWKHGPQNIGERLVLLSLADQANDEGYCWPSMDTIASRCCMSRPGVARIIKRLAEDGWLRIERRVRKHGGFGSNGYWLNLEPATAVTAGDSALSSSVTPHVTEDYTALSPAVTPLNPHLDPSIESSGEGEEDARTTPADAELVNALGTVCGMSPRLNFWKLKDVAEQLHAEGYTAEQVLACYSRPASWWYGHDWRGKRGEYPKPAQVIETIYGAVNFVPVAVARRLSKAEEALSASEALLMEFGGYREPSSNQLNAGLD